eukprot:gene10819-biopygen9841
MDSRNHQISVALGGGVAGGLLADLADCQTAWRTWRTWRPAMAEPGGLWRTRASPGGLWSTECLACWIQQTRAGQKVQEGHNSFSFSFLATPREGQNSFSFGQFSCHSPRGSEQFPCHSREERNCSL